MIGRPEGDIPPEDVARFRRVVITLASGTAAIVVVAVVLGALNVSAWVSTAVALGMAGSVGIYLVFGVLQVQRYSKQMRLKQRQLPRKERAKRWVGTLLVAGLFTVGMSLREGGSRSDSQLAVLFGVVVLVAVIDVVRGPRP